MAGFLETSIRRPVLTAMLNLGLVVFGVLGLQRLPVRELPDVDPNVVTVLTVLPGANAEVVETEVTELIEDAVSGIEGIKLLTSETREQVSSITIEFVQTREVDVAAQDVRDKIAAIRGNLPEDIDEPVISKQDAAASPIMWIALNSERHDTMALSKLADEQIKDVLQTVPGVSSVVIGGEKKFAYRIWLDAARMAALGVTVLDVEEALARENVELPSGRVENRDRELSVRTKGQYDTPERMNRLVVRADGIAPVRLEDIGRVDPGVEDERSVARFNRKPAIGLGIVRQSKANTLSVAEAVKAKMEELRPSLPAGVDFQFPYDESIYVGKSVKDVWEALLIAFCLVVLVILLFLRDLRTTLVPVLAIPISIVATFGVLYALDFSINTFTLLALVMAIGIVVDDAIVVLENIYRHIEAGMSPLDASIRTVREIAFAIIAITISLVVIFVPIAFSTGLAGRLLLEFAIALAGSVIISAFVALTLSPMIGARLLKAVKNGDGLYHDHAAQQRPTRYVRALGWCLRHRFFMTVVAGGCVGLTVYFALQLENDFMPEEDKGRFFAISLAPKGATPEYTDRMMGSLEEIVADTPSIRSYFTAVAIPFQGPGQADVGFMFARLQDGERPHVRDIMGGPNGLFGKFIGGVEGALSIPISPRAVETSFDQPYLLVLSHPNLQTLDAVTDQVMQELGQGGFLMQPRRRFELTKPELRVNIDRDRAAALGIPAADISRTLQILFGGLDVSDVKIDGREYKVFAQLEREDRLTPSDLDSVYVRAGSGELVPLSNVVTTQVAAGPTVIERFARQRSSVIEATPVGVSLGTAVTRTEEILARVLPPEVKFDWRGEARNLRDTNRDLTFFMLLAILFVYMTLAAQFESLLHPLTVLLALPLAFLGAFGSLYLLSWVNFGGEMLYGWTNFAPDAPGWAHTLAGFVPRIPAMNLNVFSLVGLIMLVGMVTKNAILLVEFANQKMEEGLSPRDAMLQAGRIRLRPILMTSFSTIVGILPIAIGIGASAESRRPMGVVIVGGMATSTFLTLFIVPVIYTLFADLGRFFRRRPAAPASETPHAS
jgi:hydrophobe/amphiphile efflux-1 (HAE1) family protein